MGAAEQQSEGIAPLTGTPRLDSKSDDPQAVRDDGGGDKRIKRLSVERPEHRKRSQDNSDQYEFANCERDAVDDVVGLDALYQQSETSSRRSFGHRRRHRTDLN